MKITRTQLKQLIQEEIGIFETEEGIGQAPDPATAAPEIKTERDADFLLKTIPKINTAAEYKQVLDAIIAHAANIPQGKQTLIALKQSLSSPDNTMR